MKQKVTQLFIAAVMLLVANAFSTNVGAQYTLYLDSVKNVCSTNSTVSISLRSKNFNNIAIMGYQGTIVWDTTVLQYDSIFYAVPAIALNASTSVTDSVSVGKFAFLWYDVSAAGTGQKGADTTILATLRFKVKKLITGNSPLSFDTSANAFISEAISIYDKVNNSIPAPSTAYLSGNVAFLSQPTISSTGTKFTAVVSETPSSYQWNLNGIPISAATDSTYTSAKAGSYTVTVGYTNGCSFTSPSVLPIALKSFTGSYNSGITSLSWSTAIEAGLSQFNVQRSLDGNNYVTIDKVAAYNIQGSTYSYLDKTVGQASKVYYLLQVIDKLGSYTYSSVVSLSTLDSRLSTISVYPNPAKDGVTVRAGAYRASGVLRTKWL